MERLTNAERETHINMVANDRSQWEIFSDDPVMIARLDKIATAYSAKGEGRFYRLSSKQVTLRNLLVLSDEQRNALRERLALVRERNSAT